MLPFIIVLFRIFWEILELTRCLAETISHSGDINRLSQKYLKIVRKLRLLKWSTFFFFKFLIVDFSLISSPEQSPIRHRETSVEVADERPPYEPRSPDYVPLHTPTYPMQLVSFYLHVNFVKFEFITDSSTREFSERRTGACSWSKRGRFGRRKKFFCVRSPRWKTRSSTEVGKVSEEVHQGN